MRIPDYALGPNDTPPPEITESEILAAIFGDEPVLLLLPRFAMAQFAANGKLVTGDALESGMRARGAVQLTDLDFPGEPVPGWHAIRNESAASLRITAPDGLVAYDGGLESNAQWQSLIADNAQRGRGVVLIACSATRETVMDMLATGRASWLRMSITLA